MANTPKVGFGKHFESMYEGSMIRAGAMVFAVMGYVIAKMKPAGEIGQEVMMVELNPELLAFILGEPENEVKEAIAYLCKADPKSRTKAEDGKRLVKEGEFAYRVVNGFKYRDKENRDPWKRKEQNRVNQANFRLRKKGQPLPMENAAVRAFENGDTQRAEEIAGRPAEKPIIQPVEPLQPITNREAQMTGIGLPESDDEDFSGLAGA